MRRGSNKKAVIISAIIAGLMFVPILFRAQIASFADTLHDQQLARDFNIDAKPEIKQIEDAIDLTDKAKTIFRASRPQLLDSYDFNIACPTATREVYLLGCFDQEAKTISIYHLDDTELRGIIENTMAHEFLHAVWARKSDEERLTLRDKLYKVLDSSQKLQTELSLYPDDQKLDELFARAGTEVANLPDELSAEYAKYFISHDKIIAFYQSYSSKFDEITAQRDQMKQVVSAKESEVQALQAEFIKNRAAFERAVERYNYLSSTSYDYNSLYNMYNALIEQRDAVEAEMAQLNAKIDEFNRLVDQYNTLNSNLGELYQKINSHSDTFEGDW
ncbi:MAG: hypothetical protein LBM97_02615 [Candidatus Nomurabacteria bacterium]|jgi:uncharacterized protein YdcH (DUF465 family)|nr:hypothetical protein [Candidatus Nomurabacteria bacterium]